MRMPAAAFGFFITLLPIFIPILIREQRMSALFNVESYKIHLRDTLFLIVVTAAVGLTDLTELFLDGKTNHISKILEFGLFVSFTMSLIYALVYIGICARYSEDQLRHVRPGDVRIALWVTGVNLICALCLKYLSGAE